MTRKDYVQIAKAINKSRSLITGCGFAHLVNNISAALAEDNPRFDADRFEAACYDTT